MADGVGVQPLNELRWLVMYPNMDTFSYRDGRPVDAPRHGVQIVLMEDDKVGVRHEVSKIGKWGWWNGEWRGFEDAEGWNDYLFEAKPVIPLFGRTLPDEDWYALLAAKTEMVLGIKKFGWTEYELRRK